MKTRNLLLAFALPTLFAACTAEEIVNQADNNAVLENRALLGDLITNIENPVASRASWSEEDLSWGAFSEEDVFSGAVVDAERGTVGDNLFTNYIFKNVSGSWETTSQMVEGVYSFYSYNGITTKNDRKPVAFDLTAQVADLDNPTKVIDDNQLFFSPLYNIEAKNTTADNTIALPLTFYPYHSIAAFKMTNATGQTLLISQIIAQGKFAAKGSILPSRINAVGMNWYVRKGEATYKLDAKTWNTDGTVKAEYTEAEIKKMWQEADLDDIKPFSGTARTTDTNNYSTTLAMDCANWEWADGEEIMAYMVIPAGSNVTGVDINVVDEEGEAKVIKVADTAETYNEDGKNTKGIASTGMSKQTFKRSIPVSIFGYTSAGVPKGITAKAENLKSNEGYYISSKEELIELINVSRGNIKVYNYGALAVDAEIAELIAEYTGGYVQFTNSIDIKDTEAEKVVIENIIFGDETADVTTVKEGTTVEFKSATVKQLVVEAGATVTIKAGEYGDIKNEGTLSVEALKVNANKSTISAGTITTAGALTIKGYDQTVVLEEGSVEYVAIDIDNDGSATDKFDVTGLTVNRTADKNASIKIGSKVTWKPANGWEYNQAFTEGEDKDGEPTGKIANKLTAVIDGAIETTKNLDFADLTVNGKLTANKLRVVGTATNNGEIEVTEKMILTNAGVLNSAGTLYNNGDIYGDVLAYKNGYVEAADGSSMTLGTVAGNSGYARVNNTAGGNVQLKEGHKYVVYYQFDEDFTAADLVSVDVDLFNINTIVFNAKFTMDKNDLKEVTTDDWKTFYTNVKSLEFKNGSEVYVKANNVFDINAEITDVYVEGAVKIAGWSAGESKVNFPAAVVTMAADSELTLDKVTMNCSNTKLKGEKPASTQSDANLVTRNAVISGTVVDGGNVTLNGEKATTFVVSL